MDPADPQQLNGYAYASNAPATQSDSDGLMVDPGTGGGYKSKATSGGSRSQRGNGPSVSDDAGSDASNRRRSGASSGSSRAHSAGQSRTSGRGSSARASNSHHESQWDRWKQRGKDAGRGVGNVAWDAGQGIVQLGAIAGVPGSYWVYEQWGEPALNDVHEDLEEWGGGEKSGWYYGAYSTGLVASSFVGGGEAAAAGKVTKLVEISTPKIASATGKGLPTFVDEGIYIVKTPVSKYVGQSGNISRRLAQHVVGGKFTQAEVDAAQRFYIDGGKSAREVGEQLMIDQLGGIRHLLNRVNPIGPKRFVLMPQGYSR